jgi:hypothetical protein
MHVFMDLDRLKLPKFVRACCFLFVAYGFFAQAAEAQSQPPTISGSPTSWVYVGQKYSFKPTARDPEGRTLSFRIENKPAWATFSSSSGLLTGTPTAVGLWNGIRIFVSDGTTAVQLPGFSVRAVSRSNVAPTISGTPATTATVGVAYSFQAVGRDANGDPLVYSIVNRPAWASFDQWTGLLSGTPSSSHVGTYSNIQVSVRDGGKYAKLPAFSIRVSATSTTNRAPTISGTPATSARVGTAYSFRPTASDADGDTLGFTIQNRPSWASFSTANGTLSGTPTTTGSHSNIIISVSDGRVTRSLPAFAISVAAASSTNTPPVISGSPVRSVTAGSAYSFRPTASDANGDSLTFAIANRPAWASFNTATGQLSGTPSATNAGTYSNVAISVSDGRASVSLPAFSISVTQSSAGSATLSWSAPTQNTDGTPLTNLSGYRIHYGNSASVLSQTIQISNAGLTTYVVENLAPGTYYFAVRAYTAGGTESDLSNVAVKTVQ